MQLMCCGVETNGWYVYRQTQWYQQFGSRDDRPLTYQGEFFAEIAFYIDHECLYATVVHPLEASRYSNDL
jgi:hypothetical protein